MPQRSHRHALGRSRADTAAQVEGLRAGGAPWDEVADQLGIAVSTAREYRRDPDGRHARERKARAAGVCVVCGRATSGARGSAAAPERCAQHSVRWTLEAIAAALRRDAERRGRFATARECGPASGLPSYDTVRRVCGSLAAGRGAAARRSDA